MSVYAGKLEIQVVEGQDLVKKTHMMDGKADPYVKFSLQSENCRSKTHKNGGKNPVWNDSCSLNVNPGGNVLQVAVSFRNIIMTRVAVMGRWAFELLDVLRQSEAYLKFHITTISIICYQETSCLDVSCWNFPRWAFMILIFYQYSM